MSSTAEIWAWEVEGLTIAEKVILVFLARKAAYENGQAAWPALATIAKACSCDERTVRRNLESLQAKGLIRLGDGVYSSHDQSTGKPIPANRRSKTWDVLVTGNVPSEYHGEKDDKYTKGMRKAEKSSPSDHNITGSNSDESTKYRVGRKSTPKKSENRKGTESHKNLGRKSTNKQYINNYPPTPLKGGIPPQEFSAPVAEPETGREREQVDQLIEFLASKRQACDLSVDALTAERAVKRERAAARALLEYHPMDRLEKAIGFALTRPFWASRIRSISALKKCWEQLADDMLLARKKADKAQQTQPATSWHKPAEPVPFEQLECVPGVTNGQVTEFVKTLGFDYDADMWQRRTARTFTETQLAKGDDFDQIRASWPEHIAHIRADEAQKAKDRADQAAGIIAPGITKTDVNQFMKTLDIDTGRVALLHAAWSRAYVIDLLTEGKSFDEIRVDFPVAYAAFKAMG